MAWSLFLVGSAGFNLVINQNTSDLNVTTDTRNYWEVEVLQNSRPQILACLAAVWFGIFFTIHRGVSVAARIAKWTILLPYLLLITLLIKTVQLPGASNGILYFITPSWAQLLKLKVWKNAAAQVFNSIGVAFGGLVTFGSFRTQGTKTLLRDSMITVSMNAVTSIISGLLIFSAVGVISETTGDTIQATASEGIDLLFVVYPVLFKILGNQYVWSIVFFTVVLFLGFNTEFAMVQAVQVFIEDFIQIQCESSKQLHFFGSQKPGSGRHLNF